MSFPIIIDDVFSPPVFHHIVRINWSYWFDFQRHKDEGETKLSFVLNRMTKLNLLTGLGLGMQAGMSVYEAVAIVMASKQSSNQSFISLLQFMVSEIIFLSILITSLQCLLSVDSAQKMIRQSATSKSLSTDFQNAKLDRSLSSVLVIECIALSSLNLSLFALDTVSIVAKTSEFHASFNSTLAHLLTCITWSLLLIVWITQQQESRLHLEQVEQQMEQTMQFYGYTKLEPEVSTGDGSTNHDSWSSDDDDDHSNG